MPGVPVISPDSALVIIDLQHGITALPTVEPADHIVQTAARLAAAFRSAGRPVVLVNTDFSADRADMLAPPVDAPPPAVTWTPDFAELRPELGRSPGDILVTKRQWDAFYGTELDLQMRRRHVDELVLAGISTSIGIESTARHAFSHGYKLVFARDAMTDLLASAHTNSVEVIFPRLGQLKTSSSILTGLQAAHR